MTNSFSAVGMSSARLDSSEKVGGAAKYADDYTVPGMLYGTITASPIASGRIKAIDLTDALAVPGVISIITADDLPDKLVGSFIKDEVTLARGHVRYVGEPVAAVAAETKEAADLAAQMISVDYEDYTAVCSLDDALAQDAPLVHPDQDRYTRNSDTETNGNIFWSAGILEGDPDSAWGACDVIVEDVYETPAQYHAYMEPCSALAEPDLAGRITVRSTAQSIFYLQGRISEELDIPMSKIRCIAPKIGGGFGGKNGVSVQPIAVALARASGRPVKITLTRAQDMEMLRSRHPTRIKMRTGAKQDGTLVAREAELWFDAGAYSDESPAVLSFGMLCSRGPYNCPNVRVKGHAVYTNKLKAGSFRGFGNPQATFASESQLDALAAKLDMDPIELRRRNAMKAGDAWLGGQTVPSCAMTECLDALDAALKKDVSALPALQDGWVRGVGVSGLSHISGLMGTSAFVNLRADGTVALQTGVVDIGQGSDTVLPQICAETLRLPLESIAYATQDTDSSPYNWKTAASRITYTAGRAVMQATVEMRDRILNDAADMLECSKDDLELEIGGTVRVVGSDRQTSFREIAARAFNRVGGPIMGHHAFAFDGPRFDPKRAEMSNFAFDNLGVYVFGAVGAVVDVDTVTGKAVVQKVWSAHDIGRAINPQSVEGQVHGAVVQGVGYALLEELVWENGHLTNPSFMDYKIPDGLDSPDEIVVMLIEDAPETTGPYGAKSIGEAGIVGVAPAIANAIYNATGARMTRIPMTSERLLNGILSQSGA
ncbi:xanthine dehydrogenase family protein molybdopterin-binding subunit [Hwanghaeella sp. LZ110]|uniref:xanthine dehydrogenase family protein molybdopterin-binding subunit n=1 Tax=Hwanghaeella sp. LZ110 TaxID=3402810 RepID=UPI003B66B77F